MKKLFNSIILASGLFILGCSESEIVAPDFNVSADKAVYNVGDSVQFNFSGSAPNTIAFYSGEAGKEYKYKDRTELAGKLTLNITTQVLYGAQANNLKLLYSTDFSNKYDTASVRAAKWTDITNRFTLSTAATGAVGTAVVSGDIDISDIAVLGKPVYFAFQYIGEAASPSTQRTWRVNAFNFSTSSNGISSNIGTATTAGWVALDFANSSNKWVIQNTAPYIYFTPSGATTYSEDWVISKAFFPTSVNADVAVGIKSFYESRSYYRYSYKAPGTYKATFVASNAGQRGMASTIREVEITIK